MSHIMTFLQPINEILIFMINPVWPSWFTATTLTSWHLMVTYCSLHVAMRLNFFESKPIDMKTVTMFGILNGISIGLLNLSLGFNSIGFYQVIKFSDSLKDKLNFKNVHKTWFILCFIFSQMTKLAIIPFTVLLETIFLKKQFRYLNFNHKYSAFSSEDF